MGKERPKWEEGKPQTGGRETHAAWEEESKCETNISTSMTEIQLNKYKRNPIGKYCCVESPNWRKKKPKLEEGRKAAPQPHSVHLCEVGQWESARSRVEKANSVRSCLLSMKIFATICHGRKIPRSQGIRSPDPLPQVGRGTWLLTDSLTSLLEHFVTLKRTQCRIDQFY